MNLNSFGRYGLILAFIFSFYSLFLAILGAFNRDSRFVRSAVRAAFLAFFIVIGASIILWQAFLASDFTVELVYHYTDSMLPFLYKLSAFWAGQSGSLLFWTFLLSLFFTIASVKEYRQASWTELTVLNIMMMGVLSFFLTLIVISANPFARTELIMPEGMGLNPLLQHPAMVIHPPTLFFGYVGFAVPFAYAMAALILGKFDSWWIVKSRNWTLFSWVMLTTGIVLGGKWAYVELGWGGYWAWDPVENASFIPWLTGTALVHSMMLQKRRNMMKRWNMVLVIVTFLLCIFGTYLTRSGILSSVHAFAASGIGKFFLAFIVSVSAFSFGLVIWRWEKLAPNREIDNIFSKETGFLLNNILMSFFAFVVLAGTMSPLAREVFQGKQVAIGADYYIRFTLPIGIVLLTLLVLCPVLSWRSSRGRNVFSDLLIPLVLSALFIGFLYLSGIRRPWALVYFGLSFLAITTIIAEIIRGIAATSHMMGGSVSAATWRYITLNRHKLGAFIIHVGVIFIIIGITASSAFQVEKELTVKPNEEYTFNDYKISKIAMTYKGLQETREWRKKRHIATVELAIDDQQVILHPEKNLHENARQPMTEVAIHSSYFEDFYIMLAGWSKDTAIFMVYINPLIKWMWIGLVIMYIGTVVVMLPRK